jgi:hypothetical protein
VYFPSADEHLGTWVPLREMSRFHERVSRRGQARSSATNTTETNIMALHDDWKAFAMELWGISIVSWEPDPERAGKLPAPLEYDTLQDGLMELATRQRHVVLQCLSCFQVMGHAC